MTRKIFLFLFISHFWTAFSQETTLLKVDFWDYCPNISRHAYMAEMILNDTVVFKKIIDTAYFEFNVPRFLISKKEVTVTATRYTDNEILGTICYPYINTCKSTFEKTIVPRDSLLNNKEFHMELKPRERWSGCGNLPSIVFDYNASTLDSALLVFSGDAKSIRLLDTKWDSYCIAEIMRGCDSIVIIGHADIDEKDANALSLLRAEVVKSYFSQFGVSPTKIVTKGIGFDKPRFSKETLEKLNGKNKFALTKLNARVQFNLW